MQAAAVFVAPHKVRAGPLVARQGGKGGQDAALQLLLGREREERERGEMWYFVTLAGPSAGNLTTLQ